MSNLSNHEAERAVIGALMLVDDLHTVEAVMAEVRPEMFTNGGCKAIAEAIASLMSRAEAVDMVTVTNELHATGTLQKAGGQDYVIACGEACPSTTIAMEYARIVREWWQIREGLKLTQEIQKSLQDGGSALDRINAIASYNQKLDDVLTAGGMFGGETLGNASTWLLGGKNGVSTPWPTINKHMLALTKGLPAPGFVIVNGYRGTGKTMIGIQMLLHAARLGVPTLMVSLEMPVDQVDRRVYRMVTGRDEVPEQLAMDADDPYGALSELEVKCNEIKELGIEVIAPTRCTIDDLDRRVRQWYRKTGGGMVLVDYIQLIECDTESSYWDKTRNVADRIGRLARAMPNAVLVGLSQITRDSSGNVRARGGSEWENPATFVCVLESHDERNDISGGHGIQAEKTYFRLGITKNRHGPGTGGTIYLARSNTTLQFEESPLTEHEKLVLKDGNGKR